MARDLVDGGIRWTGKGVVNPFCDQGGVVDLAEYPKLSSYLYRHYAAVAGRHVSSPGRSPFALSALAVQRMIQVERARALSACERSRALLLPVINCRKITAHP